MGIDSDYYKEKNKKQLTKLRMLEAKLPPYVTSYLDDKELSSQVNTVIARMRMICRHFSDFLLRKILC